MRPVLACFLVCYSIVEFVASQDSDAPLYNLRGRLQDVVLKSSRVNNGFEKFDLVPKDILVALEEDLADQFTKCSRDILYSVSHLKEEWALQLLDSFGKLESGVFRGNAHWVGDYSECLSVSAPSNNSLAGNFSGRYCSIALNFSSSADSRPLTLTVGVCIPDSCQVHGFQAGSLHLPDLGGNSSLANASIPYNLTCQARDRELNGPAKGVIALICIFCSLALIGSSITAAKYFSAVVNNTRKTSLVVNDVPNHIHVDENCGDCDEEILLPNDESSGLWKECETFFECFCIFKNGSKILNIDQKDGELLCIHGIRFLSMSWVILGHGYVFGVAEIRNLVSVLDLVNHWPFQIVLQGFFSVDSFFVLSGFLMTYLFMQESTKKKGNINWCYFYVHRYVRLTPVYMVVLAFSATVYFYLGSGPFWPQQDVDNNCKNYWWWNLLYINNFQSMDTMCFAWSWYLANDMQFFIISPLILILLLRRPKLGFSVLAVLLCACWFSNFGLTYHYDLLSGVANLFSLPLKDGSLTAALASYADYFQKFYVKPYSRIAPYLVGMLTGYLVFLRKQSNAPKHSLALISVGWLVASTMTLACVYGLYHHQLDLVAKSFYNALRSTTWAVGLGWVIYVCLIDQADIVNKILSFKLFIPLSRLTYSAYLIHPLIIMGYYANLKTTFLFAHPTMVLLFLGFIVVTYILAFLVTLVIESPIIALEKLSRQKFS